MQTVVDSLATQQKAATMLVVIDSALTAPETLTQGVKNTANALLLNPEVDAIAQITEALAQRNYTSLHLVSHGTPGSLHLGKTKLTVANLREYRQQLLEWGVAEILIYGCEVAKGPILLQQLYNLTGANIAASWYRVGKGNWDLEWQIGEITSESGFTQELRKNYQGEFVGFQDQVTFGTGSSPKAVAIGDLDGDNNLDLVVANRNSDSVSVLLGDGSGSFDPQQTFQTGSYPNSVAIGDLDGDSNLDLAVANYFGTSVSVLLGDGSGSFDPQQTFGTGDGSYSVAIGDLDGDSNLDLAVANFGSFSNPDSTVSVLLGDGSGSFDPQQTFGTGRNPRSVVIGDLDGDSNLDLAMANFGDDNVSVLLGDGSGNFTETTFAAGDGADSVAIGDLNGDGNLDLVVANRFDDNVSVLLGDGSGNFTEITFDAGGGATSVDIGDLNGDSNLDLAVANRFDNNVSVLIECFLSGTRILTDKGEIAVENLVIGDRVVTAEGKLEPVKWIGYQTVKPNQVKQPLRGYPILIKAGALGNNLPQRDLYVSPDHGMYFEGVLINAGALVNGTSIIKTEPTEAFTYYHVELENHALLLAEGALAESYLPQNEDRLAYENWSEYEELYPYGSNLMLWPMDYPRVNSWVKVPWYMRNKLNAIAEELGFVVKAA